MNANIVQEPSKLIQSSWLEDMSLKKKQSNHGLEYQHLNLNNEKILNVINNCNHSVIRNEHISENRSLFKKIVKNVALSVSCIGTGFFCSDRISTNVLSIGIKILNYTNFCPSSVFPNDTSTAFYNMVGYPFTLIFGSNFNCSIVGIYGPIFEELTDRVLLQEFLLKRVPEKILKNFSPKYTHLTNHCITKITRVFLSSVFFALSHPAAYYPSNGDMYPYLLGGAALGTLQEVSGHPFYNITAHMIANLLSMECFNRWR